MDLNMSRSLLRSPVSSSESPSLPSVPAESKARVDRLLERVDNIVPSDAASSKASETFSSWFREACIDLDSAKYASQRLHHYWLSNRSAVTKAAMFLSANWMAEVSGLILRKEILTILEEDFKDKQCMQTRSPEKFLNAAAFLIEIFTRIRINNNPLAVLVTPAFEYLEDLLTGDESEIALLAKLVISVSPTLTTLQDVDASKASLESYSPLQGLFSKVRSTLASRNLSSASRLWLLFIADISSSGILTLPSPSLQMFYKDKENLGNEVDDLLKSLMYSASSKEQNATKPSLETNKQLDAVSSKSECKDEAGVTNQVQAMNIFEKPSRGSQRKSPGKFDNQDRRENFRSAFNIDSRGNKGKSYWLHDDRFEKDETYSRENKTESLTKPRASQGNWRQPTNPRGDEGSIIKPKSGNTQSSAKVQANVLAAAGHLEEENWD